MSGWETARNILCVRLDSLGDVLMTTPAIRALRESGSGRQITLLTSPAGERVAELVPEIDRVIAYDAPWIKMTAPRQNSQPDYAMVDLLRRSHFDAAVIFTVYSQNPLPAAMLCYMADIPLRLAHCHENPYQLLSDWIKDPEPAQGIRHEVQRQLDLVAEVGSRTEDERLSLQVLPAARERVRALLEERGIDASRPWVVVHAGATAASRRYPPGHFARAVRELVLAHDIPAVFTGTGGERELVDRIQQEMGAPSTSLVGELALAELASLVALAPVLITNNSGPAHVAAAVGTPVVDLYALTNPQHTPWQVPARVLYEDVPCRWCYRSICPEGHHNCLELVEPERVVEAALALLKPGSSGNGVDVVSTAVLPMEAFHKEGEGEVIHVS